MARAILDATRSRSALVSMICPRQGLDWSFVFLDSEPHGSMVLDNLSTGSACKTAYDDQVLSILLHTSPALGNKKRILRTLPL